MLERGVEVDVVGDVERQVRSGCLEGNQIGSARHELVDPRERVLPRGAAQREKCVEGRGLEHRAETGRGEVEDSLRHAKPDAPRVAVDREDAESDRTLHCGSIPSETSSSTGSKKLQLPIEWIRSLRTRASSSEDAERSLQANESLSRANAAGSVSARALSSSPAKVAAASRLRKPCPPFVRTA